MNFIVYIYYPVLVFLLFFKSRFFTKNQWNEDFLSLNQTKALQGFSAICIVFHHLSQKTAANWIPSEYIIHGLDPFVNIGYLFVAIFFFFSGYGLFLSYKTKENYLQNFIKHHIGTLLLTLILSNFLYLWGRSWFQTDFSISSYLSIGEPFLTNPYAWYIFTLLIIYLVFYFSFKYAKSEKAAILFTSLGVLLYIIFCDFMIYGTWWYNSVPAFIAGLLFAKNKETIINRSKKSYILILILSVLITISCFSIALIDKNIINRFVILIAQMICSVSFVITVLLLGMKIKIGNRFLAFLGSITLEIYLIHGLFVQLFGYCFITEASLSKYYIKNLPLYVLVVLVLTIPLAFLLHFVVGKIKLFFTKNPKFSAILIKDGKKLFKILLIIIIAITLLSSISSHIKTKNIQTVIDKYINHNIIYVNSDSKGEHKIAVYSVGEGPRTVVMTGMLMPTLSYKNMAKYLSEAGYRIIAIDFPGTGFSPDTDSPRTIENLVDELHTVLLNLNINDQFILYSNCESGPVVQMYSSKYPQQIKAVIAMDPLVSEEFFNSLKANKMNKKEWLRQQKRWSQESYMLHKTAVLLGFADWTFEIYKNLFQQGWTDDERNIICEYYKRTYYSKNYCQMNINHYDYMEKTQNSSYPDNIPVLFLLGHDTIEYKYFYGDWETYHNKQLTSSPLSQTIIINGDYYSVYYNARNLSPTIIAFLNSLDY